MVSKVEDVGYGKSVAKTRMDAGGMDCRRKPLHITEQHPPDCCSAYGSSRLSTWWLGRKAVSIRSSVILRETRSSALRNDVLTDPHMEGTMKSLVLVQYCINLRGANISTYTSLMPLLLERPSRPNKGANSRHRCLRNFDSGSLQVFFQSGIELVQAS